MDLKKELRIIVKYMLPKEAHDKDIIENYVDTLALINDEYVKQLMLGGVSQQRELLDWLSDEPDHNIRKSDIDEILQDFKYYQSNCG